MTTTASWHPGKCLNSFAYISNLLKHISRQLNFNKVAERGKERVQISIVSILEKEGVE